MKSAITLAQVPEAKAGPFVFHQPLSEGFSMAAELGFDAVELFLPGPDFIDVDEVKAMASEVPGGSRKPEFIQMLPPGSQRSTAATPAGS